MSEYQEYKIKNLDDGFEVFFVRRAFDTALDQAQRYIERNKGKFPMQLFRQNANVGPRWIPTGPKS